MVPKSKLTISDSEISDNISYDGISNCKPWTNQAIERDKGKKGKKGKKSGKKKVIKTFIFQRREVG